MSTPMRRIQIFRRRSGMDSEWDNQGLKRLWTFEDWFVVYRGDRYYIYERAGADKPERLLRTERTKRTAIGSFIEIVEERMIKRILAEAGVEDADYAGVWNKIQGDSLFLMDLDNPIIRAEYRLKTGAYNGTLTEEERNRWELDMADKYETVTPMPEYLIYRYKSLKIITGRTKEKAP